MEADPTVTLYLDKVTFSLEFFFNNTIFIADTISHLFVCNIAELWALRSSFNFILKMLVPVIYKNECLYVALLFIVGDKIFTREKDYLVNFCIWVFPKFPDRRLYNAWCRSESIEWFIEDQTFSPSYDLAPPPPPLVSKLSPSQSSCVSPVELTDGRGG